MAIRVKRVLHGGSNYSNAFKVAASFFNLSFQTRFQVDHATVGSIWVKLNYKLYLSSELSDSASSMSEQVVALIESSLRTKTELLYCLDSPSQVKYKLYQKFSMSLIYI
jgi:hypothetical protein